LFQLTLILVPQIGEVVTWLHPEHGFHATHEQLATCCGGCSMWSWAFVLSPFDLVKLTHTIKLLHFLLPLTFTLPHVPGTTSTYLHSKYLSIHTVFQRSYSDQSPECRDRIYQQKFLFLSLVLATFLIFSGLVW